ncbi:uncharacterized protein LOC113214890 [Frankliniella occidentalis]|uniref:Uncharacterized protein LOC113214890 n=1 Tax=Frankliniella occidentalis TaxID=133901 RepID=A0A6J1TBL4_FRAOC|nr:uncharacterized protein LOC113214890 [Frankliniella occidentalis]
MGKPQTPRVTCSGRASDYKNEGMYVFDSKKRIMHCKHCEVRVDWEKKSSVDNHCSSNTHLQAKEKSNENESRKRQTSINDSFQQSKRMREDREEFIKSTVRAFTLSNIPLHKLDNPALRGFIKKYIPGGGDLPCVRTLRDKYVPILKADYDATITAKLQGRQYVVLCDETTNRKGEAVLVTLLKCLPSTSDPDPFLVVGSVKVLTACNADQCCKAIIQTLLQFDLAHENCAAVVSDGAAYMTLCAKLLKELVNPNLVHIQCWAHKTDKVVKVFSDKLQMLHECVMNTKQLFKNTRKRKHRYIQYLKDTYSFSKAKEPKLFPMPVMTRWGSWKKSVQYISTYLEDVTNYAKTIPESEKVNSVQYFKKLSADDLKVIKTEADFVVEYCSSVCDLILFLEGSLYPMAHVVYSKVNDIKKVFHLLGSASNITSVLFKETKSSLQKLSNQKQRAVCDRIKAVAKKCDEILTEYLANDTARNYFQAAQTLFNPSKIVLGCSDTDFETAKNNIALLNSIPLPNFKVLHGLLSDAVKEYLHSNNNNNKKGDVMCEALLSMKTDHPEFFALCMQVLHMPVSNVDSERAFSAYNDILSSKRCRLSAENTEIMICMYFSDEIDMTDTVAVAGHDPDNSVTLPLSPESEEDPDDDL